MFSLVKVLLPDTSIMLTSCDRIHSICKWMFDQLYLDHFAYCRSYDNGKSFELTGDNGQGLSKQFIQKEYEYDICANSSDIKNIIDIACPVGLPQLITVFHTPEISAFNSLPYADATKLRREMEMMAEICGIKMRFYLSVRYKSYVETAGFGTYDHTAEFYEQCITRIPIFRNFIEYFKQAAKDIIDEAEKQAIVTCEPVSYDIKHFTGYDFFNHNKVSLNLTSQESACVMQLRRGKTTKEIAKNLKLSPRTVESYLNNIKTKTGHSSKSELIDFLSLFSM